MEAIILSEPHSAASASAIGDGRARLDRPRVIAMINQKGGVGKTTTTVNLGAGLARLGYRVLMIDLDPQAHMTLHLGLDPDALEKTVYDVLAEPEVSAMEVAQMVSDSIAVLPAQVNLAGVESELASLAHEGKAQHVLRDKVHALMYPQGQEEPAAFDYVILDCPPSLGLLTVNALSLATEVLVPMQAHFLALQGLSKLLETVSLVKQGINPNLKVAGVILCMYEGQTVLANEVVNDLTGFFEASRSLDVPWRDAAVLSPAIRRNIKLAECPSHGQTIFEYEPNCAGAQDYKALVAQVASMAGGR
jgi:chromosome partitioning protein